MVSRTAVVVLAAAACSCATAHAPTALLPALGAEGEVHVYALPPPRDAERLAFTVGGVSLVQREGGEVPLRPEAQEAPAGSGFRRLAAGRVPPGEYVAVAVTVASASLASERERARLLVDAEPVRVELPIHVVQRGATVIWLALQPGAIRDGHAFAPAFGARIPPPTPPAAALYATSAAEASVTICERSTGRVTGVVPVGAEPVGIALDRLPRRAYVSLSREDQIEILDLSSAAPVGRIRLSPGDAPGELGLAADGTLLVVNERSRTVSFVDPVAMTEVARVPVGDGASALLLDRAGRRAYVANRSAATVTVIDVGTRSVLGTLRTDPEPLRMQLSRDGARLYVVHRGSAYLASFAIPSLAADVRAYVGLGATSLKVDARSGLLYLARSDGQITVLDPVALQPLDDFPISGAASYLAIDDAESTLLALVPERATIAVVDLTRERQRGEVPVGAGARTFAFAGERP